MDRRTSIKLTAAGLGGLALPGTALAQRPTSAGSAPGMPAPTIVPTNGIDMAVYAQGAGVPVVFCHGFPELAFSWRHQFHAASNAGFRAIAPDLRGYGLTERPLAIEAYTSSTVCDDLVGMLDAMDVAKAVFCGHDWGGYVVDTMPLLYPERCLGVIGIGAHNNQRPPDLPAPNLSGTELLDKPGYNGYIQLPATEAFLDSHVRELFSLLFSKEYLSAERLATLPADSPERSIDLTAMIAQHEPGELFVSADDLDYYIASFEATGFGGGINWYRAIDATVEEYSRRTLHWGVNVPYLYIWPEQDPINRHGLDVGMEDYIPDLEKVSLRGAGHFAHEEQPAALSAAIVDWLSRKFGVRELRNRIARRLR
jgi:pimeloyl-ACP methyl ester carboxylesterase